MRLPLSLTLISLLSAVTLVALPLDHQDQAISIRHVNELSPIESPPIKSVQPRSNNPDSVAQSSPHKLQRRAHYQMPRFKFGPNSKLVIDGLSIFWTFVGETKFVDVVTFVNHFAGNVIVNLYSMNEHALPDKMLHTWNIGAEGVVQFKEMVQYQKFGQFVIELFTIE
ncbi:predicted protein [Plenodomus lingam JN3]|uniref:Predicted protein n=1 Tax=Leptosphaeria maculans (strain JN3 / isolate v23.1.3 / race Av1-4-5-6-7-8) TaxID=985895 RepID=E5AFK9_LEPMJ|nr:predicted protein [Plenodomus lingam JN3]CBY01998.1 predicted protein [Plenodomus lingam JN3]